MLPSWQRMMTEKPDIPFSGRVAHRRALARDLSDHDPIVYPEDEEKPEPTGIQVGGGDGVINPNTDSWDPRDFVYRDNGYKGAVVAAEDVAAAENVNPGLEVGAEHLEKHRKALRRLTEEG